MMTHPVYRSLNRVLTIWGVERKTFFAVLLVSLSMFQVSQALLSAVALFLGLWVAARAATKVDPRILKVLIANCRIAPRLDPALRKGNPRW